jgi:hypothetical protein
MAIRSAITVVSVDVPVTAVQLIAASMGRGSVIIQNLDAANPIFVGPSAAVVSTKGAGAGFRIKAGDQLELDETNGAIFAIATGGTVDVRVLAS